MGSCERISEKKANVVKFIGMTIMKLEFKVRIYAFRIGQIHKSPPPTPVKY